MIRNCKKICLAYSLILLYLLTGCGRNGLGGNSLEETLEKRLHDKYNENFKIEAVTEEERLTWMDSALYGAEVIVVDTGDTFYANITEDGLVIQDTYPQTIYDNEIQRRLQKISETHSNIVIEKYNYRYYASEEVWVSMEEIDDYLEKGPSVAFIDISLSGETPEEVAEQIQDFLANLREHHFQYNVACNIQIGEKDGTVYFVTTQGNGKVHEYEEVLRKMKGVMEK